MGYSVDGESLESFFPCPPDMCLKAIMVCHGWCWTRPSRIGGHACPSTCRSSPTFTTLWLPSYDVPRAETMCLDISISLSCGAIVGLYGKCLLAGLQKVLLNEISSHDYCLSKCFVIVLYLYKF